MKQHLIDKFIAVLVVMLIGFAIFLKISATYGTEKLKEDEIKKSRYYAQQIATLIEKKTNGNIEKSLNENTTLRLQLNEILQAFLTEQYHYIFLLNKNEKNNYQFLLDASKENAEEYKNIFFPQSSQFDEVYKNRKMKIIAQNSDEVEDIWLSVVYPIVKDEKTEALLILDISKEYAQYLQTFNSPLMNLLSFMQLFLALSLFILIFLAYKYYKTRELLIKDKLTSLYTKYYLNEFFKVHTIHDYLAILIDIDELNNINQKYDRDVGDEVLKLFSKRLTEMLPKDSKVIRFGGSEFFIIIAKDKVKDQDIFVEQYYRKLIDDAYIVMNYSIFLDVSMIAMDIPEGVKHIDNVIRLMDENLLNIKKTGKNRFEFIKNITLEDIRYTSIDYIKTALDEERFTFLYQPICNTKSKEIVKYEVLVRMIDRDNVEKLVSPSYFLNAIRFTTQYSKLSKLVLTEVFSILEKYKNIEISMNLDLDDLFNPEMMTLIENYLIQYQHNAPRLTFEILEDNEMYDFEKANEIFSELHQFGSKIAIDDFGKGYANYIYLSRLDIDIIKLDASFIYDLERHPQRTRLIIESIQLLADKLGCEVVAEYVYNESTYAILKEIGVDFSQGYYLGKPERLDYYLKI